MCRVSQGAGLPRLFFIGLVLKTLKIFVDGFDPEKHLPRVINHEIQVLNAPENEKEEGDALLP